MCKKQRASRCHRLIGIARELDLPAHVKAAYGAQRAQQAQRCRRAVQRSLAVTTVRHEVDEDAKMAWNIQLQESKAFVAALDPWFHAVKSRRNRREPRIACCSYSMSSFHSDKILQSERNFRKTSCKRRNGLSFIGTDRRRIACEKTRFLKKEADAAERNSWYLTEALRNMSSAERDKIYIMNSATARDHISIRFPWLTSRARAGSG